MSENPFRRPAVKGKKPHFGSGHQRVFELAREKAAPAVVSDGQTWAGHTEQVEKTAAWDLDTAIGAAAGIVAGAQERGDSIGLGTAMRSATNNAAKNPVVDEGVKPKAVAPDESWEAKVAAMSQDERDDLQTALYGHVDEDEPTPESEETSDDWESDAEAWAGVAEFQGSDETEDALPDIMDIFSPDDGS